MAFLRRSRTFFLAALALVVAGATALVALAHIYEDEVKAALVSSLNDQLNAPVSVGSMDLTLLRRFPLASLHLKDVLAMEVAPGKEVPDTLLHADDLYLEFDLWDLFRGDYTVRSLHGDHVLLRPVLDAQGARNYVIWKSGSTSTESAFALQKVSVNELHLRYHDARTGLDVQGTSERSVFRGVFTPGGNTLSVQGLMHLDAWSDAKGVRLSDRTAQVRFDLAFGGRDGSFHLSNGEVLVGDAALTLTLAVVPGEKGDELDLRASGFGLDLATTTDLLPDDLRHLLRSYQLKGTADLALRFAGPLDGPGPSLSLGIDVREGRLKEQRSGVTFTAVQGGMALELSPSGDLRTLKLTGLSARSGSGSFTCSGELNGPRNAQMKADIKGTIGLADLMRFARVDTLEQVSGRLQAEVHVEGRLREASRIRPADLKALRISGSANLREASLKMKGLRHQVTGLDAALALEGTDAVISALSATVQGSRIDLKGTLHNLMPYLLFDDQSLLIAAQAHSPHLDLAALMWDDRPYANAGVRDYQLKLPVLIALELEAAIDELVFEEFSATGIHGHVRLKDRALTASPLNFRTASGEVFADLHLDGRGNGPYTMAVSATAKDIAIDQLFMEFQDFGQTFITHAHLSGKAQAQIDLSAPLSAGLALDLDRLRCTVDIALDNGAIKGHQPLMEVADHVRSNKFVAPFVNADELRKRLANVTFARLENRIEVRDRTVIVPAMEVRSSAMDLEVSGTQTFDGVLDHHLNFRLGDVFRTERVHDAFGPVVDDGTGMRLFLHMTGTTADPRFANDGAAAAARRSKAVREQTAELRSILKNELNLFGKSEPRPRDPGQTASPPLITLEPVLDTTPDARTATAKEPRRESGRLFRTEEEERGQETFEVVD